MVRTLQIIEIRLSKMIQISWWMVFRGLILTQFAKTEHNCNLRIWILLLMADWWLKISLTEMPWASSLELMVSRALTQTVSTEHHLISTAFKLCHEICPILDLIDRLVINSNCMAILIRCLNKMTIDQSRLCHRLSSHRYWIKLKVMILGTFLRKFLFRILVIKISRWIRCGRNKLCRALCVVIGRRRLFVKLAVHQAIKVAVAASPSLLAATQQVKSRM